MPSLLHKDDEALQALIQFGKYKEALKHVDKKLKKTPTDHYQLASKAEVLLLLEQGEEAINIIRQLCESKPPITDRKLLLRIDKFCPANSKEAAQTLQKLWLSAIKTQTDNKSRVSAIAQDWVTAAIACRRWSHVVPAAKFLHDNASNIRDKRKYQYWQAVARYMESVAREADDPKASELNKVIACKLIVTLAGDKPEETLKPPELNLLSTMLYISDGESQLLALSNDNWRVTSDKIKYLQSHLRWTDMLSLSKQVLNDPRTLASEWKRDDFLHWEALATAVNGLCAVSDEHGRIVDNINIQHIFVETVAFVRDRIMSHPKLRSPRKALLRLLSDQRRRKYASIGFPAHGALCSSDLMKECIACFDAWSKIPGCAQELYSSVALFSLDEFLVFRERVRRIVGTLRPQDSSNPDAQLHWMNAEISALHIDQNALFYRPWFLADDGRFESLRTKLLVTLLDMYDTTRQHSIPLAPTDPQPGNRAMLLAATALAKNEQTATVESSQYFALMILETVIRASEANRDAKMLQLQIAQKLGVCTIALQAYEGLRVRSLLINSISPQLFFRIATRLPFAAKMKSLGDHYPMMQSALSFYEKSGEECKEHQKNALQGENYAKVFELDHFIQTLRRSPSRVAIALESRRIARFRGLTSQLRDRPSLSDMDAISEELFCDSGVNENYLSSLWFMDYSYEVMTTNGNITIQSVDEVLNGFIEDTEAPELGYRLALFFLRSLLVAKPNEKEIERCLGELKTYVKRNATDVSDLINTSPTFGEILDCLYSTLEFLIACHRMATNYIDGAHAKRLPSASSVRIKAGLKVVQQAVQSNFADIQAIAAANLAALDKFGPTDYHRHLFEGKEANELSDTVMRVIREDVRLGLLRAVHQGKQEALRGVAMVRIN